ncbi:D-allose transport system permease protein AlsC [Ruegeria denitrificans]|uniref:D-allose transport system permease protein AlsC n=1 Tax=Ruegeria denitrificans TaxID=1715692 RepID=A0A0P1IDC6_9RHOB|nr:ABC transporter permease [Ruegeria denitrificans]CUK06594.1 D-allose transport system permease protein AlsC [Ruegeria denitrificans]
MTDLTQSPQFGDRLKRFLKDYYIYLVLILVVVVLSTANLDKFPLFERGNFLSERNIINILRVSAPILTLAGAFTLLMISGYIDLSVGSAMSLSAVVYALLAINGVPFVPAFLATVLVGVLLGAINGFLVIRLKITPVIATLITLSLYKGIALLLVEDGVSAIKSGGGLKMPGWFNDYGRDGVFFGLPWAFWVAILVTIAMIVAQDRMKLGKYAAATGGNPMAAKLSGIDTARTVIILYVLVGICAALAGIARSSFMSLGDPLSGDGMELTAILVVLLGGTAFSGGEGRVLKSFIGALIIMSLTVGMLTLVPAYFQTLVVGTALLLAAASNHLVSRKDSES